MNGSKWGRFFMLFCHELHKLGVSCRDAMLCVSRKILIVRLTHPSR